MILPLMGWYSYFKMCSFCVVSQMRIFPEASARDSGEERAEEWWRGWREGREGVEGSAGREETE